MEPFLYALLVLGLLLINIGAVMVIADSKPWQPPRSYVDEWHSVHPTDT